MYIWFKYQQIFSEELKRCLIRKMPQLNCLLTRGTTINFFQNKTIEEDEKCQHIVKHTVVRNRFVCVSVINSTIYLRGIYRKIFFNLAEFHCLATNANAPKSAQRTAGLRRGGVRWDSCQSQLASDRRQCTILVGYDCHNGRPHPTLARPNQINILRFFGRPKTGRA